MKMPSPACSTAVARRSRETSAAWPSVTSLNSSATNPGLGQKATPLKVRPNRLR